MTFIKKLIADSLHGITLGEIPFLLFRLFMAALIVYILAMFMRKKYDLDNSLVKNTPLIAFFGAFLAISAELSIALSVLLIPALLVLIPFKKMDDLPSRILLAMSIGLGVCCGAGNVFISGVFLMFAIPFILLSKSS